eukprot:TRINITY_DN2252_c0_g1_i5.p1 TRINITY_DN2252_c0_g1~~TRINITY_DN2252_c0_g1_i5.p1  ORF type:complete len:178 (+),score=23.38 TRINITY_DN2252_c0_g1_i5:125-658(+)
MITVFKYSYNIMKFTLLLLALLIAQTFAKVSKTRKGQSEDDAEPIKPEEDLAKPVVTETKGETGFMGGTDVSVQYKIELGARIAAGTAAKDYEGTEHPMVTGSGPRSDLYKVEFKKPFINIPIISIGISTFKADVDSNVGYRVVATNVTEVGFNIRVEVWGNLKLKSIGAAWIAIGS